MNDLPFLGVGPVPSFDMTFSYPMLFIACEHNLMKKKRCDLETSGSPVQISAFIRTLIYKSDYFKPSFYFLKTELSY